jgi:hypothetical protein
MSDEREREREQWHFAAHDLGLQRVALDDRTPCREHIAAE